MSLWSMQVFEFYTPQPSGQHLGKLYSSHKIVCLCIPAAMKQVSTVMLSLMDLKPGALHSSALPKVELGNLHSKPVLIC